MPIVSRNVVKTDYLNIPATDNTLDATLDRWLAIAQNEIEDMCNQPIVQASKTILVSGTTDRLLWLGYTVPMTLTSVSSRDAYTDAFTAITGTASVVSVDGVAHLATTEDWRAAQYQIVATLGYSTVPSVIQICAAELVMEMYYASAFSPSGSRFGVSAISESAGGTSFSKTITSARARIAPRLRPYTMVTI